VARSVPPLPHAPAHERDGIFHSPGFAASACASWRDRRLFPFSSPRCRSWWAPGISTKERRPMNTGPLPRERAVAGPRKRYSRYRRGCPGGARLRLGVTARPRAPGFIATRRSKPGRLQYARRAASRSGAATLRQKTCCNTGHEQGEILGGRRSPPTELQDHSRGATRVRLVAVVTEAMDALHPTCREASLLHEAEALTAPT
jgi:hypothetical protein